MNKTHVHAKTRIAFQGERGAYSDLAACTLYPDSERVACETFEDALRCLDEGRVEYAAIPVKNAIAGPVTTSLSLLRGTRYGVRQSHWQPVHHCLLVLPETSMEDLKTVHSHWQALKQCRNNIENLGLSAVEEYDTAGAAKLLVARKDKTQAAIASALAAKEYGLEILRENFEDKQGNETLFLILATEGQDLEPTDAVLARYAL